MKFILGTKQHMTQIFDNEGRVYPATVLSVGPVIVTQVKNKDKDGYEAVQVGFGTQKESRLSKAVLGHTKGVSFKILKEFRPRTGEMGSFNIGDTIKADIFAPGDVVNVAGTSKGKGFQGVVKRHGFGGGRRSHGQKHSEREPGSIGGGGRAGGRVAKGMRMAGRMGSDRVTVKNLKVLFVDGASNTLVLSGAIPGKKGTVIEIFSKDN